MTTDTNPEDDALALAAVNLLGNKPRGEKPQGHEISAWRDGHLTEPRAAEVLSHIANDPAVFQQWLDFAQAESYVAKEATGKATDEAASAVLTETHSATAASPTVKDKQSRKEGRMEQGLRWLRSLFNQPLPVYGGAFAAVMLAVLITPLMRESAMTLERQLDRNSDTFIASDASLPTSVPNPLSTQSLGGVFEDLSVTEVEEAHFQLGLRKGVERLLGNISSSDKDGVQTLWQQWAADLPADNSYCEKAIDHGACEVSLEAISALGQWTVLTHIACEQRVLVDKSLWQQQASLYQSLRELPVLANSSRFAERVPVATEGSPQNLCSIANSLIRSP